MEAIDSSLRAVVKIDSSKAYDEDFADDMEYLQDHYDELRRDASKCGLEVPFAARNFVDREEGLWLCTLLYARIEAKQNPPIGPHEEVSGRDDDKESTVEQGEFSNHQATLEDSEVKTAAKKSKKAVPKKITPKKAAPKKAAPKKAAPKKVAKAASKPKKAAKVTAKDNGVKKPRTGTISNQIVNLLLRKKGCTREDVL